MVQTADGGRDGADPGSSGSGLMNPTALLCCVFDQKDSVKDRKETYITVSVHDAGSRDCYEELEPEEEGGGGGQRTGPAG